MHWPSVHMAIFHLVMVGSVLVSTRPIWDRVVEVAVEERPYLMLLSVDAGGPGPWTVGSTIDAELALPPSLAAADARISREGAGWRIVRTSLDGRLAVEGLAEDPLAPSVVCRGKACGAARVLFRAKLPEPPPMDLVTLQNALAASSGDEACQLTIDTDDASEPDVRWVRVACGVRETRVRIPGGNAATAIPLGGAGRLTVDQDEVTAVGLGGGSGVIVERAGCWGGERRELGTVHLDDAAPVLRLGNGRFTVVQRPEGVLLAALPRDVPGLPSAVRSVPSGWRVPLPTNGISVDLVPAPEATRWSNAHVLPTAVASGFPLATLRGSDAGAELLARVPVEVCPAPLGVFPSANLCADAIPIGAGVIPLVEGTVVRIGGATLGVHNPSPFAVVGMLKRGGLLWIFVAAASGFACARTTDRRHVAAAALMLATWVALAQLGLAFQATAALSSVLVDRPDRLARVWADAQATQLLAIPMLGWASLRRGGALAPFLVLLALAWGWVEWLARSHGASVAMAPRAAGAVGLCALLALALARSMPPWGSDLAERVTSWAASAKREIAGGLAAGLGLGVAVGSIRGDALLLVAVLGVSWGIADTQARAVASRGQVSWLLDFPALGRATAMLACVVAGVLLPLALAGENGTAFVVVPATVLSMFIALLPLADRSRSFVGVIAAGVLLVVISLSVYGLVYVAADASGALADALREWLPRPANRAALLHRPVSADGVEQTAAATVLLGPAPPQHIAFVPNLHSDLALAGIRGAGLAAAATASTMVVLLFGCVAPILVGPKRPTAADGARCAVGLGLAIACARTDGLLPVIVLYGVLVWALASVSDLTEERWLASGYRPVGNVPLVAFQTALPMVVACTIAWEVIVILAGLSHRAWFTGIVAPALGYGMVSHVTWSLLILACVVVAARSSGPAAAWGGRA